jgi:flagellin
MAVSSVGGNSSLGRILQNNTNNLQNNFKKLSSGLRVNSASDDAAGLAVATELLTSAKIDDTGSRNISDALSAANIAEGAIGSASDITTRLNELATQASNGTLSGAQRDALNQEYQALSGELDRISQTTQFNGNQLLDGSTQIGVQAGQSELSIKFPGVSASGLGLASNLLTQESAKAALDESKAATETLASSRGEIGASVARLDTAFENIRSSSVASQSAASQILDADFAEVSSKLAANKISQQASVAINAQANLQAQNVLRLLA